LVIVNGALINTGRAKAETSKSPGPCPAQEMIEEERNA
jgi:hypothetical protein